MPGARSGGTEFEQPNLRHLCLLLRLGHRPTDRERDTEGQHPGPFSSAGPLLDTLTELSTGFGSFGKAHNRSSIVGKEIQPSHPISHIHALLPQSKIGNLRLNGLGQAFWVLKGLRHHSNTKAFPLRYTAVK